MRKALLSFLIASAVVSLPACMGSAGATPSPALSLSAPTSGSGDFDSDLYALLAERPGNFFFSPLSISTTFAMLRAGAVRDGAAEMDRAFHFPADPQKEYGELSRRLHDTPQVALANKIWPSKNFELKAPFLATLTQAYRSSVEPLDFRDSARAAGIINDWVSTETYDKIKNLVPPSALNGKTRLVLTNAIYFLGKWKDQFEPRATQPDEFHPQDRRIIPCQMMHRTGAYHYGETPACQILEMPYERGDFSFVALLPRSPAQLAEVEKSLSRLGSLIPTSNAKVAVSLPRFRVESQTFLNDDLKRLGVRAIFEGDLDGVGGRPGDIYVSEAIHKAFVEVKEEGTEAAAATAAVTVAHMAARPPEPPPVIFRADHTFVFAIRECKTGRVLFLGRLDQPLD